MSIRKINAFVAMLLTIFFITHELLGMLWSYSAVGKTLAFLVWAGAFMALVHVLFCVATSRSMLNDTKRPPSIKKKRHLLLKWATGSAVLVTASFHALQTEMPLLLFFAGMFTAAFLAVHVCTGAKSMLKDLRLSAKMRMPFKAAVIAATCAICFALVLNLA